jgi:SAM-dependent methyltransferase
MGLILKDVGFEYAAWDALLQIALEKQPSSYLEVGTRYCDSLLRVLAGCKKNLNRIVISDIWHESYFGANNNGTQFDRSHKHVERMLKAMGYLNGEVMYLDGDSAKTIPSLDKREPFDLVLVDGDHNFESPTSANSDLENCWPLVAPGGYLVFDDVGEDQKMMALYESFFKTATDIAASYVRLDKKTGVAVAEKQSNALETSKVRAMVMPYFKASLNGIDVGCSRDPLTRYCVAFDRSDYPEVTHRGEADKLPFENEKFDWLWSSHTLEDFEDTNAVLTEWVRVLRPGGTIGLYVPHPDFYHGGNTDHKHPGFRIEELTGMLCKLGCETLMTKLDNESTPGCPRYSSLVIARKI